MNFFRRKTRAFSKKPPLSRNGAQDPLQINGGKEKPSSRERERGRILDFGDREREESVGRSGMECDY